MPGVRHGHRYSSKARPDVNAYNPAPDEAIKGIAYKVLEDQTHEEILEDIQDLNKGCQIAEPKRLGKTSSLLITFTRTHKVPSQIRLFGGLYPCYPFRAKTEACFKCRRAGHRADVCPRENTNLCSRCGTQHPAKETPDCSPKCILCNEDHFMGTRSCKAHFERPNYRGTKPTESQWQRGQQQDSGGHRSRSRGRSNASQRYRRSRSRSTSFLPSRKPTAKNAENTGVSFARLYAVGASMSASPGIWRQAVACRSVLAALVGLPQSLGCSGVRRFAACSKLPLDGCACSVRRGEAVLIFSSALDVVDGVDFVNA
ncbi:hypothetical protein HPB49_006769 [Dermacentor silvarum]|uniref:Uncharacterized protein n=1 Tax=Dermacentor silvarum TaxID=543639 RepID=A0ACB8DWY5_DERSI|nr:hypothetical protein HPB49_006769 [Dermacentor silvarum]